MVTTLARPVDGDLLRLRTEFLAMPGLCLTARQTARLLSVRVIVSPVSRARETGLTGGR